MEQQQATQIPKEFTPAKYRVKAMPKLQAKKPTIKKITAQDLLNKLQKGGDIGKVPLLVTNTTSLFEPGKWDHLRQHWSALRMMEDEYLEKEFRVEYWPPDKARARLIGNTLLMEEPEMVTFSRYIIICFHGTPAKPRLPGQNTEHCEQVVGANSMIRNSTELGGLGIFSESSNALPLMDSFRKRMIDAAGGELSLILGKKYSKWKRQSQGVPYQFFVFGPSGSGDKLHAENGLPFFDVLIHGSRRWLLLGEEEMERVAVKAREALEFDKTSAYMFFEEKLPELKEEFGLKKYVECNQQAGDIVYVPSGWYRVSLSLADSISYYETLLREKNILKLFTESRLWTVQAGKYDLAFCYEPATLQDLPSMVEGSQLHSWLKQAISQVKPEDAISSIVSVLLTCGSVLALRGTMPEFNIDQLTSVCTPAIWKRCRNQLKKQLDVKGVKATLAWLPLKAPSSVEDIATGKNMDEL